MEGKSHTLSTFTLPIRPYIGVVGLTQVNMNRSSMIYHLGYTDRNEMVVTTNT